MSGRGVAHQLAVNLLEWDRVGSDDGAGIGGTTFELDTFIGLDVGVCLAFPERRIRLW